MAEQRRFSRVRRLRPFFLVLFCLALAGAPARANDSLSWDKKQNRVDAQIQHASLPKVLKKIAAATGWKIYMEPGAAANVSVKFKNLPEDEALRRLLGKVNFFRDETNGVPRLFVFSTVSTAVTQVVSAGPKKDYRIPNELPVKLKPRSKETIDQLAKRLGAVIVSRDDKLGLYRLRFADANSADASLQSLNSDPSVDAVQPQSAFG